MGVDYLGPDGGKLGMTFAAGCTATWVFVRNLVMKPAIKSCHQQIADLRVMLDEYREQRRIDRERIHQLETVLLTTGPAEMRGAMQRAISETRVAVDEVASAVTNAAPKTLTEYDV